MHHIKFESYQLIFAREGTVTFIFSISSVTYDVTQYVRYLRLPTYCMYWYRGNDAAGGGVYPLTAKSSGRYDWVRRLMLRIAVLSIYSMMSSVSTMLSYLRRFTSYLRRGGVYSGFLIWMNISSIEDF